MVLMQGVGVHGDGWLPQTETLSGRYRCLTFDNRGMGASQPTGDPVTVERMANDAWALMDAEGWASAHLVGHSLGGLVAQHMAITAPARVRSLALLCTVSRGRDATRIGARMLWLGIASNLGSLRSRRRAFLRIVVPPAALRSADEDALAAELATFFGHDLARQPPIAMKQLAALRAYDATASLGALDGIATLVLSAEHDLIAPPKFGRALAARIPGAKYVEIPGAGHGVTIHHADAVNRILLDHLDSAERAFVPV